MKIVLPILICGLACQASAQDTKAKTSPAYDNVNREKQYKKRKAITYSSTDTSEKRKPSRLSGNKDELNLQNKNIRK